MDYSILPSFFKMLFALAIVIGLMVGAAYFFKKISPRNGGPFNDHSMIKVIASRYLGLRNSIMLVEVLGKVIIIGVSPNQISPLGTISEADALEKLRNSGVSGAQEKCPSSFIDFFKQNNMVNGAINRFGKHGQKK